MKIDGLDYTLDWENFTVGSSFFIPCVGISKAKELIERKMRRLGYAVMIKIVVEDGVQGLRVWRINRRIYLQPAVASSLQSE